MIEIAIVPTTEVMGVVGRSAATAVDCLPLGHAGQIELIAQESVLEDNIYSPEKVARHGFTYESVGGHVISMESYLLPERKSIQVQGGPRKLLRAEPFGMKHEKKLMKAQSGCAVLSCFSAISAKLQPVLSKLRKAESACQVF